MIGCNATLHLFVETNDVVATVHQVLDQTYGLSPVFPALDVPDGVAVVRRGDRLMRLDVTTLTCVSAHVNGEHLHVTHEGEAWTDDTSGAVSHADNTPPADEAGDSFVGMMLSALLCLVVFGSGIALFVYLMGSAA